jgi:hypothetical protein
VDSVALFHFLIAEPEPSASNGMTSPAPGAIASDALYAPAGIRDIHDQCGEMPMKRICSVVAASVLICLAHNSGSAAESKSAPEGAHAYIIWPNDGAVISGGKFWLRMGLSGAGVAPAGIDRPNTGHHHVLVDADLPALEEPIPNDKKHLHFGAGQTEARIELPPGRHTIQLLLGDVDHVPHSPPITSRRIAVIVPE